MQIQLALAVALLQLGHAIERGRLLLLDFLHRDRWRLLDGIEGIAAERRNRAGGRGSAGQRWRSGWSDNETIGDFIVGLCLKLE